MTGDPTLVGLSFRATGDPAFAGDKGVEESLDISDELVFPSSFWSEAEGEAIESLGITAELVF